MDLTHQFTVPTPVEETWAHFQDIASVAECFPGAQVTSAEGDSFSGTVKVKLGPIALVYNGSGTFVEKDDTGHRFVVDAKGKDKRGNGTAGAKVTLSMASAASGGTDVEVLTDLAITGKPAQFGRGVMQDVSDKLLGQFVSCLEQRLGSGGPPAPVDDGGVVRDETVVPNTVSTAETSRTIPTTDETPPSDPVPAPALDADAGSAEPAPPVATPPVAPASTPAPPRPPQAKADDAINLGSTVLPVLFKTYWKQGLVALVVIVLVIVLIAAL